jgi:chromosome segregation ATPase
MKTIFEIQFKRKYSPVAIYSLEFETINSEFVRELADRYGQQENIVFFLKEFISCFSDSKTDITEEFSQLGNDQLLDKIQELLSDNSHLRSVKQELERKVSELSESNANKEVGKLRDEIKKLKREIENATYQNNQLKRELSNEKNQNSQYRQNNTEYYRLLNEHNVLVTKYNALQNQVAGIPQITQDNEKLKKSKQDLEKRFQEIEQELQDTQQKLSVAISRLPGLNINSNLAGGGSRSDKLKIEFSQLKWDYFTRQVAKS